MGLQLMISRMDAKLSCMYMLHFKDSRYMTQKGFKCFKLFCVCVYWDVASTPVISKPH
jgi:hypothetical protein